MLTRKVRYKLRPKFHLFHCGIVLRLADTPAGGRGSRLNPKVAGCYTEEDLIGKLMATYKKAPHAATVSKRLVQRWQLQFNAWLCRDSEP